MPSIQEIAITWDTGSSSKSISSATLVASDAVALTAGDYDYQLQVSADNAGTPSAGDICIVSIARTTGDLLGDTGDDYDTNEHAEQVMTLDTVAANTPGEDPARRTVPVNISGAKGVRLVISCPQAASRNITVRARLSCQRP